MEPITRAVEKHYGSGRIMENILTAMRQSGKDLSRLNEDDLAPMDEFHIRGREGTVELASRTPLTEGMRVLDVGCGIGGSSRYLALEHHCNVTGIDVTHEFVDVAAKLSEMVGLDGAVQYRQASALELPFEDESFDVAWTQHVQMNIADKRKFYSEMARVLVHGGRLVFHDLFQGPGGEPYYPAPWAEDPAISSLAAPDDVNRILEDLGMKRLAWEDTTQKSVSWMEAQFAKAAAGQAPPLGINVLMGESTKIRLGNVLRGLKDDRLRVVQAVWQKP